jgi:ATP-dependent DNA helicase RecQ
MKKDKEITTDDNELPYDAALYKELKDLRLGMADYEGVPAYAIIADNSLVELATYLPQSFDEMKHIAGFGDYKISRYGAPFLKAIKQFTAEHNLEPKMHFKKPKKVASKEPKAPKEKATATGTQRITLTLFNDGMGIDEIASKRNLAITTIETHLAAFVGSGEIEVTRIVAKDKLAKILETIRATGQTMALKPIKDLLGDEYTYGEIRMGQEYYKRINS